MATTHAQEYAPARSEAIPGLWWKVLTGILMTATIVVGFAFVGPMLSAEGKPFFTAAGHGAKAIFFHVPCAWIASLAYVLGAIYAIRYLLARAKSQGSALDLDLKCAATMELGLVFSILATVTGSLFARNEWGQYWSWDPRQTSILIIMLLFAAYVVLRGAIEDPEKRGRLGAVYTLVAVVPGIFLIWVLPRIVETLHSGPNEVLVRNQISGNYRLVMYGMALPAFLMLFGWLSQLRVRVMRLEAESDLI
jgi:heme exporter protein C